MPKIIENLESRLIAEAGKQIEESGYSAMTVRSVAAGCGVGVGTVYNYFSSKEALLATYLLSGWNGCVATIPVVRCICDQLCRYAQRHRAIFRDEAAAAGFAGSFSRYHGLLRSQLISKKIIEAYEQGLQ